MTGVGPLPPGTPGPVAALIDEAAEAERRADRTSARAAYRAALDRIGPDGDPRLISSLVRWIGRSLLDDGELDAATERFEEALAVARTHGDTESVAHAVNCRALVHYHRGRLDEAERLFRRADEHARRAGERKLQAMIKQNLGILANIRGDWAGALDQYRRSLAIYEALGLAEYQGPVLNNIGRVQTDSGLWDDAERSFSEAAARCLATGQVSYQVLVLVNVSRLRIAQKRFGPARESCDRALALARSTGEGRWMGDIFKHYGTIWRTTGEPETAVEHLRLAEEIARAHEDLLLEAEVAGELAQVFWSMGRNRETLHELNRAHRLFSELRARHELADVGQRLRALEATFLAIVREWGESIESADRYTQGHCQRVADYACELARADGFDPAMLIWFRMGALLHDVGKVGIPSEILNKPTSLTEEEWAVMRRHPEAGAELLGDTEFPWDVRPMVRHHHERWDGAGYPDGLAGSRIPRAAQILAVADVFDALTSDRSYRAGLSRNAALEILRAEAGATLNPDLVALFVGLVRRREVARSAGDAPTRWAEPAGRAGSAARRGRRRRPVPALRAARTSARAESKAAP